MPSTAFLSPSLPRPLRLQRTARKTPCCNLSENVPRDELNALRAQLSEAVTAQNFTLAAQLRDQIASLETTASDQLAVTLANEAFYDAVRRSDPEAMAAVWLPSDTVSCALATSGLAVGFDEVLDSWRRVFTAGRATEVEVEEVNVSIRRNVAWLICRQVVTAVRGSVSLGGERIATNIFQKRRGRWLMVHHHASPLIAADQQPKPPPPPPPPPPMAA